jgi:hypothetical protein
MSKGFQGMEKLIADLGALSREVVQEAALPALLEVAEETVNAAKSDVDIRSGRHRRSLHVGGHLELTPDFSPAADDNWYKDLGKGEESERRVQAIIGTTLFYGYWEEFGGPKNAANPAIRRAVEAHFPRFEERMGRLMDELQARYGL